MSMSKLGYSIIGLLSTLVAAFPVFADPDEETATEETAQPADAVLALDASTLSAAFDDSGVASYRCRLALKDFEKAIADANASAVAQRAKVAEITKTFLKTAMDKARTDGDLDRVLVFQKALETVDGEIAGDAEEIVKLRDGRAAQLEKIDKGLVASGLTAANAFHAALEWQKKEITQKGEIETALKVAAFQKQVEEWTKKTKDTAAAHSSAATGGLRSRAAASEVRRPAAPVRQPVRETRPKEPEAKIVTIDARSSSGTSIGSVNAGDTVEIQYVGGKWQCHGRDVYESPDDENIQFIDNMCALFLQDVQWPPVLVLPAETRRTPFVFSVTKSADYRLRSQDGASRGSFSLRYFGDNSGSVRYSVRIIPAGGRVSPRAAAVDSRPSASGATPSSASGRVANQTLTGTQPETSVTLAKTPLPHVVKGQYFVPQGKELIVEAGATIIFERDASLYCEGTLTMNGTAQANIVCKGKMPNVGYWNGFTVRSQDSRLNHVQFEYAKTALTIREGVQVENCEFKKCERSVETRRWW